MLKRMLPNLNVTGSIHLGRSRSILGFPYVPWLLQGQKILQTILYSKNNDDKRTELKVKSHHFFFKSGLPHLQQGREILDFWLLQLMGLVRQSLTATSIATGTEPARFFCCDGCSCGKPSKAINCNRDKSYCSRCSCSHDK